MNKCAGCGNNFEAKTKRALFCSDKCRASFNRTKSITPLEEKEPSGWENSAENKTQAEIEAHYTLENFPVEPRAKYYSANGGGSGANSPYPAYDKRAAAYSLR